MDIITEGPRAVEATAAPADAGYRVTVRFAGGSSPFFLHPTRNCTVCCQGERGSGVGAKAQGDFDASHDGLSWAPGSNARMKGDESVIFDVPLKSTPAFVRYTAGSNFTQCALYSKEALPAWPFQMKVKTEASTVVI